MSDEILLSPYDPLWPIYFEEEQEYLRNILPYDLPLAIEHFGSTAIPGMESKPIIDILIAVQSLDAARAAAGLLEGFGYSFWRDNPKTDRLFFAKGLPPAPARTHHLHFTRIDGEMWERLMFRDYLRSHADDAARYVSLKRELAERFREDREAYTEGKNAFVEEIMVKARAYTPPTPDWD